MITRTIRITEDIYKRLEAHASGFETPCEVIEKILNSYEGIENSPKQKESDWIENDELEQGASDRIEHISEQGNAPSNHVERKMPHKVLIEFVPGPEKRFTEELLKHKHAYVKLFFIEGTSDTKHWSASNFSRSSNLRGNLASSFLRGWRDRGIIKARLSIDLDGLESNISAEEGE